MCDPIYFGSSSCTVGRRGGTTGLFYGDAVNAAARFDTTFRHQIHINVHWLLAVPGISEYTAVFAIMLQPMSACFCSTEHKVLALFDIASSNVTRCQVQLSLFFFVDETAS